VRVVLKGVHRVGKRLATGEIKTYFYAWRGGPQIKAKPGTPEFLHQYNDAHAKLRQPRASTLMTLIAEYKNSADYRRLSPASRRAYVSYIRLIEDEFGDMPLAALQDPRVRGEFKSWRDGFAATPRKADYAWSTLARIFSFAKDRGLITTNPCEAGGRLYVANRQDKLWAEPHVAAFLAAAPAEMTVAIMLGLWTAQRQGDLLRLPWSAYDGSHIRLQQSKTGRRVVIPVGAPLRALLDGMDRRGPLIMTNSLGRPWTSDGFRTSWAKACRRAGIKGLRFHDLRGTSLVRLALADATVPQIATLSGHALADVEAILDAHYLGRDVALAETAMQKLEARTKL
jgi:integrase